MDITAEIHTLWTELETKLHALLEKVGGSKTVQADIDAAKKDASDLLATGKEQVGQLVDTVKADAKADAATVVADLSHITGVPTKPAATDEAPPQSSAPAGA